MFMTPFEAHNRFLSIRIYMSLCREFPRVQWESRGNGNITLVLWEWERAWE